MPNSPLLTSAPSTASSETDRAVRQGVLDIRLLRYATLAIAPALVMLYAKYHLMYIGGFRMVARSLGRIEASGGVDEHRLTLFSFWEKLSFFRADLLVGLILSPLCLCCLAWLLGRRLRAPILAAMSILLTWFAYVELETYGMLGRFLSWSLIKDAVSFQGTDSEVAHRYLGPGKLAKLGIAALFVVACAWWARRGEAGRPQSRPRNLGLLIMLAAAVLATATAWLAQAPSTRFHKSIASFIAEGLLGPERIDTSEFDHLSNRELIEQYRQITGAPPPLPQPACWGEARDCDVLLFILETGPARCLPADGDLSDCPTLNRLRARSFVAANHYSVYPYTSRAIFSILTSWYPTSLASDLPVRSSAPAYPGLMHSLHDAGYATALYATDAYTHEHDERTYRMLGIERRWYPAAIRPDQTQIERDRAALTQLKQDISAWHRTNQRFAAIFLPQIGHAPWPDLTGGKAPASVVARGRAVIARQDAWLGELVSQIEAAGRLDKTIIMVTGDHGIRTRQEDPDFAGGMIDDYSFHVPLFLYVPAALTSRQDIPWMTSHIDVTPSILDLLGISAGRESEQGSPIWDSRLQGRTTYFWANHFLGADGYHSTGHFAMWNHISDTVYAAGQLHFDTTADAVVALDARKAVIDRINRMVALEESWANHTGWVAPAP